MGGVSACDHPPEHRQQSIRIWAWGLLTDWRYWAVALGCAVVGALVSAIGSGLGWTSGYVGGGAMAGLGVYAALTMGRVSRCERCGQIVRAPLGVKRERPGGASPG